MQPPSDRPACRASERPMAAHVALFALVRRVGHHGRTHGAGAPLSQQPRQGLCDGVQALHRTAAARRDAASVPEQLGMPTRLYTRLCYQLLVLPSPTTICRLQVQQER